MQQNLAVTQDFLGLDGVISSDISYEQRANITIIKIYKQELVDSLQTIIFKANYLKTIKPVYIQGFKPDLINNYYVQDVKRCVFRVLNKLQCTQYGKMQEDIQYIIGVDDYFLQYFKNVSQTLYVHQLNMTQIAQASKRVYKNQKLNENQQIHPPLQLRFWIVLILYIVLSLIYGKYAKKIQKHLFSKRTYSSKTSSEYKY